MIMNRNYYWCFIYAIYCFFYVTEYIEIIVSDNGGNPNKSCVIGGTSLAYDDTTL